MITLVASTRRATAVSDDAITTRSVGIPVTLDLSEHFDGLSVTLVCKAGEVSRDIAMLDPDALEVPVDCLQVAGVPLLLGLVGKNAAGTIVIRTTMASAGTIRVGTEESDVSPSDPVPDWTVQVQQWAEDAHDTAERLAQEVDGWQDDIDAAVEGAEAVDATVEQGDGIATVTVTDRTGTRHTATVCDGATGPEGPAGYSPSARVTQTASGATITVTDQSGTTTATIHDGADGRDGADGQTGPAGFSPTVAIESTDTEHTVTITDATGPHSYSVPTYAEEESGREQSWSELEQEAQEAIDSMREAAAAVAPEVAWLRGNVLMGELEGVIDSADDVYAAPPRSLEVYGSSTQVTTTGKNLLNPDTSSWPRRRTSSTGHGTIVESGGTLECVFLVPVEPGQSLTYSRSGLGKPGFFFVYTDDVEMAVGSVLTSVATLTNFSTKTWTNETDAIMYAGLLVTYNNRQAPEYVKGVKVQLEYASSRTDYEPYSEVKPSPCPDWPQPIISVDGLALVTAEKNLVNYDLSNDGYLNSYGAVVQQSGWYHTGFIPVIDNSTYCVSGLTANSTAAYLAWYDSFGNCVSSSTYNTVKEVPERTPPANARFLCMSYKSDDVNLQIEIGSTATAYEPYQGTTVPLLPEGTSLRSLPDGTKDQLSLSYLRPSTQAGWAWYSRTLTAYTGEVDLGSLDWSSWTSSTGTNQKFQASLSEIPANWARQIAYCSCYTVVGATSISSAMQDDTIGNRANSRAVLVRDARFVESRDAASFKTAVSGQKITYRLETPITTQLDPIELPVLPAPTATVWCDGGSATPSYTMQYVRDTNLVVQQLEAAIADLATN